jgi:hypothetical protein
MAGMIVLRERHKGAARKAADAVIDPLFKLLSPLACRHTFQTSSNSTFCIGCT